MESAVQVMELLKRTYSNYLPMAIAKVPEFLPFISDIIMEFRFGFDFVLVSFRFRFSFASISFRFPFGLVSVWFRFDFGLVSVWFRFGLVWFRFRQAWIQQGFFESLGGGGWEFLKTKIAPNIQPMPGRLGSSDLKVCLAYHHHFHNKF